MLDVGDQWTGRTACLLQDALRLSNNAYAQRLGIAVRTVAAWHEMPHRIPNSEMQQLLTTALERAPAPAQARFATAVATNGPTAGITNGHESTPAAAQTLTVAIAIVRDESRVLLVQRRGDADERDSWQFPAGMIKPGLDASTVAVRETLGETGVHCAPTCMIGSRVHPRTNVLCEYVFCDYLNGDAENRDPGENVSVTWTSTSRLTRFIPAERIFAPVLAVLEVST
jgi:8-oxo-dGTP diphosphatase